MGRWCTVKNKKGAADAKRGILFTKIAKEIQIAAKKGGDLDMNPGLKMIVDKAKTAGCSKDIIDRAIKRGTGEDKDAAVIEESIYEGYGPGGVAIIIECLSDNKNRTASNVRSTLTHNGGNLGTAGSVMYNFEQKGQAAVDIEGKDAEELMLELMECGIEDAEIVGDVIIVVTAREELMSTVGKMQDLGYSVHDQELAYIPKDTITIEDEQIARDLIKLIEKLDDDEDVSRVASNMDISDEMLGKINE